MSRGSRRRREARKIAAELARRYREELEQKKTKTNEQEAPDVDTDSEDIAFAAARGAALYEPEYVPVAPVRIIYMTPKDWAKVPANPYQKENRAKRKNVSHLFTFAEEHATVRMGIYPCGKRCKIDAHTRSDIWENRPYLVDKIPERLRVECYNVADDEEAAERFKRCDNRASAKNASDDVHGAFRLQGIPTESDFFKSANNIKAALFYAYEIVMRGPPALLLRNGIQLEDFDPNPQSATIDDYVTVFKEALAEIDKIHVNRSKLKAPFITAFLVAYMKHGKTISSFFRKVNEGSHGEKHGRKMCPIAAIERERDRWRGGGKSAHIELVVKVLGALETYMEGDFTNPDYKPAVKMEKIMTVDLAKYLTSKNAKRTGRTKKDADNDKDQGLTR